MSEFAVKIPFIGKDLVSNTVRQMDRSMRTFGNTSNSIFRTMHKNALSFRSIMGGVLGAGIVQRGFGLVETGARSATGEIVKFDHQMVAAGAKFGKSGFNRFSKEFSLISKAARETSLFTGFAQSDAAGAMHDFAQAGLSVNDALRLIRPAGVLAKAGDVDMAQGAKYASTAMAVFNKEAKDFTKIGDILTWTANASKMSFADLYETLKMGGGAMRITTKDMLGDPFAAVKTWSAIARAMGDSGIIGEQAGTHMKTGFLRLISGGKMADSAIAALGIKSEKNGRLLDPISLVGQLEAKYKGMSSKKVLSSMRRIFGLDAGPGMFEVMKVGSEKLKQYFKEAEWAMNNAYSAKVFDKMSLSYETKINRIKSSLVEIGFKLTDTYGNQIPGYLDKVAKYVADIDSKKIGSALSDIKDIITGTYNVVKFLSPALKSMAVIWAGFKIKNGISTVIGTSIDSANMIRMMQSGYNPITGGGFSNIGTGRSGKPGFLTINRNTSTSNDSDNLIRRMNNVSGGLSNVSNGFNKTYMALNKLDTLLTGGALAAGIYTLVTALDSSRSKLTEDSQLNFDKNKSKLLSKGKLDIDKQRKSLKNKLLDAKDGDLFDWTLSNAASSLGALFYGTPGKSATTQSLVSAIQYASQYATLGWQKDLGNKEEIKRRSQGNWFYNPNDPFGLNLSQTGVSKSNPGYWSGNSSSGQNQTRNALGRTITGNDLISLIMSDYKKEQKVQVEINFAGNVPEGTTATVKNKQSNSAPSIPKHKLGVN